MKETVLVKNTNVQPYEEIFNDEKIYIEAGGTIKMSRHEAMRFLGSFSGMGKDGQPVVKMLSIIPITTHKAPVVEEYLCMKCGIKYPTQLELNDHLKEHSGETFTDEELEKKKEEQAKAATVAKESVKSGFVKCPMCGKDCKGKIGLCSHLKGCKGEVNDSDPSEK